MDGPHDDADEADSLLHTFENVELISFHKTTRIESSQTVIDEIRYIFENSKPAHVRYIMLVPREREKERELSVYDQNHTSLPLIAPEKANDLFIKMCKKILDNLMGYLKESKPEEKYDEKFKNMKDHLPGIFDHSSSEKCFENFKKNMLDLSSNFRGDRRFVDIILKLIDFLKSYAEKKYRPLVFLPPEPEYFAPKNRYKQMILIDESVKRIGEFFQPGISIAVDFFGKVDFSYKIEPQSLIYYSYGVIPPKGIAIKDINFDFGGKRLSKCRKCEKHYNKNRKKYFDSDYFHLTLDGEKSEEISKCERKIIRISFGMYKIKSESAIFIVLVAILWLCISFPSWS